MIQNESEVCAFRGLFGRHGPHSQQWLPHRRSRSPTPKRPSTPSRSLPSPRRPSTRSSRAYPPPSAMASHSVASGTSSWTETPWPDLTPSPRPTPGAHWPDPTPASSFLLFLKEAHSTRSGYPPNPVVESLKNPLPAGLRASSTSRREKRDAVVPLVERESSASESSAEVDLEEVKINVAKVGNDCRICHLSLDATNHESGIPIELRCSCKADLAAAHKQCAEAWFKMKGNNASAF
ncbi:hypothetical protein PS1_019975 [Malus domestica]